MIDEIKTREKPKPRRVVSLRSLHFPIDCRGFQGIPRHGFILSKPEMPPETRGRWGEMGRWQIALGSDAITQGAFIIWQGSLS